MGHEDRKKETDIKDIERCSAQEEPMRRAAEKAQAAAF